MSQTGNLKVVHVSCVHPATDSRIFEKECTTLAENGYEVTLVATGDAPSVPTPVKVITRPRYEKRAVRFLLGPPWAIWRAVRLRPDVIHLHDPELIPLGAFLSLLGWNVIFDSHEDLIESVGHKPYLRASMRAVAGVASRLLIMAVNGSKMATVSATPHIAKRFRASTIVHNFPLLDDWQMASDEALRAGRLVYVGGITESRGLWEMIEATHLVNQTHRVTLTLAGPIDESLYSKLHPLLGDTIRYAGKLDRPGVSALLSSCSIGLVLFDPSPNNVHGKPTKLYEYMAAGLPCIASDFPLWRAMVLEPAVGAVADPKSPQAIADAVRTILDHPEDASAMGARGRQWVMSQRNWSIEARALLALYQTFRRRQTRAPVTRVASR